MSSETNPYTAALIRLMADELDRYWQILHDGRSPYHPMATEARAALAAEPHGEGPAKALAARFLLEQVARLADRIGQHTVGEIMVLSDRAAALRENPPGPAGAHHHK